MPILIPHIGGNSISAWRGGYCLFCGGYAETSKQINQTSLHAIFFPNYNPAAIRETLEARKTEFNMKKILSVIAMFAVCGAAMAQSPAVSGDVDGDGECTTSDVTVLYNYLLYDDGSAMVAGDQDGDGYITVGDVTWVYNVLLYVSHDDGHDYIDLGLPSGTQWATMNVGASSPEDYGDYFAWGETSPKDVYDLSTYKWCNGDYYQLTKYCTSGDYGYNGFTDGKTELDPEDDAATAAWGAEWRMPSKDQMEELYNNCTSEWTTRNGVNGRLFTSNINGASLFLPAAGYRGTSSLYEAGTLGDYWSRTLDSSYPGYAYDLYFSLGNVDWGILGRDYGQSVRAVRVPQN